MGNGEWGMGIEVRIRRSSNRLYMGVYRFKADKPPFIKKVFVMRYLLVILGLWLVSCKGPVSTAQVAPELSKEDQVIFDSVQRAAFRYFWEGAEPVSGLARERYHADNIYPQKDMTTVTSGGAGFGVMAILVAMERNYITREEGRERLEKIVHFLETADRFHGAWPIGGMAKREK